METESSKLISLLTSTGLILGAVQCALAHDSDASNEKSLWTIEATQAELDPVVSGNVAYHNYSC